MKQTLHDISRTKETKLLSDTQNTVKTTILYSSSPIVLFTGKLLI